MHRFTGLLYSGVAAAQEKPEAPKPKHDRKVFLAGVSLLAASNTADAITTRQLLDRGGRELNPIFGSRASPAKEAGINAGIFVAQAGLFYLTERSRHKWIRWTGRALIGNQIVDHAKLAVCNSGIDLRSPVIRNCQPLAPF